MTHNSSHRSMAGYQIQTAVALILFILGLMLLVVWAILYANRLGNNLNPEWWIWFFLAFGITLMIIGLIWLIIVQYIVGFKAQEMYEELYHYEHGEMSKSEKEMHRSLQTTPQRTQKSSRSSVGSFAHNE